VAGNLALAFILDMATDWRAMFCVESPEQPLKRLPIREREATMMEVTPSAVMVPGRPAPGWV
jgi:hypothetical protein